MSLAVLSRNTVCHPALIVTVFLLAFAKLQKRLLVSSCLSDWNNSATNGRIFMKFDV
jgi:hypothetical protein